MYSKAVDAFSRLEFAARPSRTRVILGILVADLVFM